MTKRGARFFKEGGTPSEPPALRVLIIHEAKKGVKIIDDRPVITAEGAAYQVGYNYQ